MKTCQPHLYSGKCNSRPWDTVSQPFNWQNVRNLKYPMLENTQVKRISVFLPMVVKLVQPLWKAILCSLVCWTSTFCDLALSFLCLGSLAYVYLEACKNARSNIAYNSKNWNSPNTPLIRESINKLWYTDTTALSYSSENEWTFISMCQFSWLLIKPNIV